jgi:hypothetical protein
MMVEYLDFDPSPVEARDAPACRWRADPRRRSRNTQGDALNGVTAVAARIVPTASPENAGRNWPGTYNRQNINNCRLPLQNQSKRAHVADLVSADRIARSKKAIQSAFIVDGSPKVW